MLSFEKQKESFERMMILFGMNLFGFSETLPALFETEVACFKSYVSYF